MIQGIFVRGNDTTGRTCLRPPVNAPNEGYPVKNQSESAFGACIAAGLRRRGCVVDSRNAKRRLLRCFHNDAASYPRGMRFDFTSTEFQ
jgi:hypothetical protein